MVKTKFEYYDCPKMFIIRQGIYIICHQDSSSGAYPNIVHWQICSNSSIAPILVLFLVNLSIQDNPNNHSGSEFCCVGIIVDSTHLCIKLYKILKSRKLFPLNLVTVGPYHGKRWLMSDLKSTPVKHEFLTLVSHWTWPILNQSLKINYRFVVN